MKNRILTIALFLCYTSFNMLLLASHGGRYGRPSDFGGKRSGGFGGFIVVMIVVIGIAGFISDRKKDK